MKGREERKESADSQRETLELKEGGKEGRKEGVQEGRQ
jgi:hypothetical protein